MKKRIFVAVEISDEARRNAAGYAKILRERFPAARVGWEKTEKLHLTMKFLGETDPEQLAALLEAAEDAARKISPFRLQISGTGVFPSPKQARILWLGVKGEAALKRLNEILESECERRGFPKEKRSFRGHLTIGRLKEKSADLVENHLLNKFEPVEFEVGEIVVFESRLQPTGSIYSVISRHVLGGNK
jgi:2'-5' RNA ligase